MTWSSKTSGIVRFENSDIRSTLVKNLPKSIHLLRVCRWFISVFNRVSETSILENPIVPVRLCTWREGGGRVGSFDDWEEEEKKLKSWPTSRSKKLNITLVLTFFLLYLHHCGIDNCSLVVQFFLKKKIRQQIRGTQMVHHLCL